MTLLEAVDYFLTLLSLVGVFFAVVIVAVVIGERVERNACRRRHPASVARRARIVAQRRARLDGRG